MDIKIGQVLAIAGVCFSIATAFAQSNNQPQNKMEGAKKAADQVSASLAAKVVPSLAESRKFDPALVYQRLLMRPLAFNSPKRAEWNAKMAAGQGAEVLKEILFMAGEEPVAKYNSVYAFSVSLNTEDHNPLEAFDDYDSMISEFYAYDLDFSQVLSIPIAPDQGQVAASIAAAQADPSKWDMSKSGLQTTQGFAQREIKGGTNRRPIKFMMDVFLCAPISMWANPALYDKAHNMVRRDVTRTPGGDASVFNQTCSGCHAPMDALAGSYAKYEYSDNRSGLTKYLGIVAKMNQNNTFYPEGHIVDSDYFVNLLVGANDPIGFGWRTETSGHGINQLGEMITHAKRFNTCMVNRVSEILCPSHQLKAEEKQQVADDFEKTGYKLKTIFADVATSPSCGVE